MAKNQQEQQTTAPTETPASQENLVIVDANALAATIAAAVAQTMAGMQQQAQVPQFDLSAMGEIIGAAVAQGIAKNTRRKVTPGEYEARGGINSYHPKTKAETPV